jgi:hypothetical protein
MSERVRKLQGRIKPPASKASGLSPRYERFLTHMNHARAVLDYEDRKASAEAGGRLDVGEPPAPLPPPTLDEMKDDLESSLWFLNECIPLWRAADQVPESHAQVDDMEHHTRDEIARLRAEIRAREEGSNA